MLRLSRIVKAGSSADGARSVRCSHHDEGGGLTGLALSQCLLLIQVLLDRNGQLPLLLLQFLKLDFVFANYPPIVLELHILVPIGLSVGFTGLVLFLGGLERWFTTIGSRQSYCLYRLFIKVTNSRFHDSSFFSPLTLLLLHLLAAGGAATFQILTPLVPLFGYAKLSRLD